MLTDEQLKELDEAEKKATPGIWHGYGAKVTLCPFEDRAAEHPWDRIFEWAICASYPDQNKRSVPKDDCDFVALARNHMRALIDEVKAHRKVHQVEQEDKGHCILCNYELENEKLHAELQAARDALCDCGDPAAHKLALKRIEESGLLK